MQIGNTITQKIDNSNFSYSKKNFSEIQVIKKDVSFKEKVSYFNSEEDVKVLYEQMCKSGNTEINANIPLAFQIGNLPHTSIETENYIFEQDKKNSNCFIVKGKNGYGYGYFDARLTTVEFDPSTSKTYLIEKGFNKGISAGLSLNDELEAGLKEYLGTDKISRGNFNQNYDNYNIYTDKKSGINTLQLKNLEAIDFRIMYSTPDDLEYLRKLSNDYKEKYPNITHNGDISSMYALLELAGFGHQTPNGIITVFQNSISYNDETDLSKNWTITFGETSETYVKFKEILDNYFIDNYNEMEELDKWLELLSIEDQIVKNHKGTRSSLEKSRIN